MRVLLALFCLAAIACGGGSGPTTPLPPPPSGPTITIGSNGVVAPKELTVSLGARVLFINNDTRRHDMASDQHPDHMECPELNIGALNPGQSRETRNLVIERVCAYHDHDDFMNTNLQGRIIVR